MTQFINTLCLVNNYNYKYIWETLIYHIDKLRKVNNDNKASTTFLIILFLFSASFKNKSHTIQIISI